MFRIHQFACRHVFKWLRNIYDGEIIHHNGKRSIWRCDKCGKLQWRDQLHKKPTP